MKALQRLIVNVATFARLAQATTRVVVVAHRAARVAAAAAYRQAAAQEIVRITAELDDRIRSERLRERLSVEGRATFDGLARQYRREGKYRR